MAHANLRRMRRWEQTKDWAAAAAMLPVGIGGPAVGLLVGGVIGGPGNMPVLVAGFTAGSAVGTAGVVALAKATEHCSARAHGLQLLEQLNDKVADIHRAGRDMGDIDPALMLANERVEELGADSRAIAAEMGEEVKNLRKAEELLTAKGYALEASQAQLHIGARESIVARAQEQMKIAEGSHIMLVTPTASPLRETPAPAVDIVRPHLKNAHAAGLRPEHEFERDRADQQIG